MPNFCGTLRQTKKTAPFLQQSCFLILKKPSFLCPLTGDTKDLSLFRSSFAFRGRIRFFHVGTVHQVINTCVIKIRQLDQLFIGQSDLAILILRIGILSYPQMIRELLLFDIIIFPQRS